MTEEELRALIVRGEDQRTEFKAAEADSADLARANRRPGEQQRRHPPHTVSASMRPLSTSMRAGADVTSVVGD